VRGHGAGVGRPAYSGGWQTTLCFADACCRRVLQRVAWAAVIEMNGGEPPTLQYGGVAPPLVMTNVPDEVTTLVVVVVATQSVTVTCPLTTLANRGRAVTHGQELLQTWSPSWSSP
jgi:hypothetical protein